MLGASTFNPVGDLTLPQLAIRQAINIPIDTHVYLFESSGGYVRFYECPEMIRVTSPYYFKIEPGTANLYKPWAEPKLLAFLAREKVKYAEIIIEIVENNYLEAKLSKKGASDLAIPQTIRDD